MSDTGNLYVISAPSGTGKTTLVKALVASLPQLTVSISHTTRPRRPGEIHGENYYFVSLHEFEQMIKHQDFLEHATIFENFYGTSKSWVEKTIAEGQDVILEIDWQGYQQIKRLFKTVIGIFILPPSLTVLKERLINRQQDSISIINRRLTDVKATISHITEYDYVVLNDDFSHAINQLKTIIESGRYLAPHQIIKYQSLISELLMLKNE